MKQKKRIHPFLISGVVLGLLSVTSLLAYSAYQKHIPEELKGILNQRFYEIESRSLSYPDEQLARDNYRAAGKIEIPKLNIKIKPKAYKKIEDKRREALGQGFLFSSSDDYVSATIKQGNKKVKAKIRLKGDFTDHLNYDIWSFRIKVSGDKHLFGMRRFSIQAPHTKYFHHEAMYMDHLRKEGLLAVRYFFVDVSINDGPSRLMAVEEHFSKELLESQSRREGVIVRYDEDHFWSSFRRMREVSKAHGGVKYNPKVFDNWKIAWVRPFRQSRVKKSQLLSAQSDYAASVLSALGFGKLKPSEVFDIEKMGRFMAIADLWGVWHPIRWHNMRFYVNPVNMKLEPIGFDVNVDETWRRQPFIHKEVDIWFWQDLLKDEALRNAYINNYQRMLQDPYLNDLQKLLVERESEYLKVLHRDFPSLPKFDFNTIKIKQEFLRANDPNVYQSRPYKKMEFNDVEIPPHVTAVYAYLFEKDKKQYLELINPLSGIVEVNSLEVEKRRERSPLKFSKTVDFPIELSPNFYRVHHNQDTPLPRSTILKLSKKVKLGDGVSIVGKAKVRGQRFEYTFKVKPYVAKAEQPLFKTETTTEELLSEFSFLAWDGKNFSIEDGEWIVESSLEIPPTVIDTNSGRKVNNPGLTVAAGANLLFEEDVYLKLSGPLVAKGTSDQNIVFTSVDEDAYWPGIAVIESPQASMLEHVEVSNTSGVKRGAWQLTGAITFYKNNVNIRSSVFNNNVAEDALNIINANFELEKVTMNTAKSDAFDCDFCIGSINDSEFNDIEGDAIDFSGSDIRVANVRFSNIADKAISVGEASGLVADNVNISNVSIAVASKDGSDVKVSNGSINNVSFAGLMAYNKKPEYGPSKLQVDSTQFNQVDIRYLCQKEHHLSINGERVYTLNFDLDEEYSTGFMRRK